MSEKKDRAVAGGGDTGADRTSCPIEVTCPTCGFVAPITAVRCPRCNMLLLTGCNGGCAACGSRSCLRPDDLG